MGGERREMKDHNSTCPSTPPELPGLSKNKDLEYFSMILPDILFTIMRSSL